MLMNRKQFLISTLIFAVFIATLLLYSLPRDASADMEWMHKIDMDILKYLIPDTSLPLLPPSYIDFVTTEAAACRLRMKVATLEANTAARATRWPTTPPTWEITIGVVSTWDAVNIENLVHELTHAGAGSAGAGEVAARKAEAASWQGASGKPARGSGQDQSCWSTYDMVYNKDGTQRSHDQIKKKLKTYGYAQNKM